MPFASYAFDFQGIALLILCLFAVKIFDKRSKLADGLEFHSALLNGLLYDRGQRHKKLFHFGICKWIFSRGHKITSMRSICWIVHFIRYIISLRGLQILMIAQAEWERVG
jgi:hypothetical protein